MQKPQTHKELEEIQKSKMSTFYKVKDSYQTVTKDVDMSSRVVSGISNTFNYFDFDQDVLLPGSTTKSINDRGPKSNANAKIKNVKDHVITDRIGVPKVLEERTVDGKTVQYFESEILNNTKGNDTLIEYQAGAIDQHSIGYMYTGIDIVTADDANWKSMLNRIINPKDAENAGYMFVVTEIKQHEFSPVSFGANLLTPYLGMKSQTKEAYTMKVFERIDLLEKQLKHGKQTDEAMLDYQLECLQLKQIISELFNTEPSVKDTLWKGRQNKNDTHKDVIPFDLSKAIQETKIII